MFLSFTSTKCGLAPVYIEAFAVATKVSDGIKTSSPFCKPESIIAKCNADVPELTGTR